MLRRLVVLALTAFGLACNTPPTTVEMQCTTSVVFEQQPFYIERPEPERQFRGSLEFRDVPATPNGRDHRFFLDDTPVYSGDARAEASLRAAVGRSTVVRGKLIDFSHGPELWPASVTVCV